MKNTLKYSLMALLVGIGMSTMAHARDRRPPPPPPPTHCDPPSAPEVDPGMAISGLTLLAGTLTIVRSARRK